MDVLPHVHGAKRLRSESSIGRIAHGRSVQYVGTVGETSGRFGHVHGAKRLLANPHGAKCLVRGETTMGRNVNKYMGLGRNVHGANCQWGEKSINLNNYVIGYTAWNS